MPENEALLQYCKLQDYTILTLIMGSRCVPNAFRPGFNPLLLHSVLPAARRFGFARLVRLSLKIVGAP